MTEYRVSGRLAFRGHKPGTTFFATLDPDAELRALARGNVEIIDSSPTRLRPGSYRLPDGWIGAQEPAKAGSSFEGSN